MSEAFARRYKLLDRIAIGGTAEVFRALFLSGDGEERPVVIKRVLPQFARDERFRRLFHEEACVAVTMSHPSIVRVLDHGDIGQTCYIALELVDGKDLGSLLSRVRASGRPPDPVLTAYLAAQVASALEFIHEQKSSEGTPLQIIHRDVSPQNILVSYRGDVKLTDFGIAKSAIRQDRTVDGALRGKLDYMAPEQAMLGEVDGRTDIFALGCVLYEMLEGTPPFRGESEIDTLERVRAGRMRLAPDAIDAPPPLQQVLCRCLAPRREDRYQRAAELASELRAYLASEQPPVTAEELGGWVRASAALPEAGRTSSADQAVRRLLGEGGEENAPGSGTTVFASSPRPLGAAPSSVPRRLNLVLAAVAALGLCGWLLWGLGVLSGGRVAPRVDDARIARIVLAARPDQRAAGSALVARDLGGPTLLVSSVPSNAAVLLGGEPLGWTPLRIRRPSASTLLELAKEGYLPFKRRLNPEGLGSELRFTLQPLGSGPPTPGADPAPITINSMPWSRVRIDGRLAGNTPLRKYPLRPGPHRVELLGPDSSVRKSFQVVLSPGKNQSFSFDFTQP